MKKIPYRSIANSICILATLGALGILLFWKLKLGLMRYFDGDEMAYLHWAHNVFTGLMPYRDFLLYATPGFLFFLSPLFAFVHGTEILWVSRVIAWIIFVGICWVLGSIFVEARFDKHFSGEKAWLFLLPGLFFAFLPIPADKLLEIRPDNLAIFFGLMGLYAQIRAIRVPSKKGWFISGVFYGLSVLILQKTAPFIAISLVVSMCWWMWADVNTRNARGKKVGAFIAGLGLVGLIFSIFLIVIMHTISGIESAWYQFTKLPFEVNRLSEVFYISPELFFYPNTTLYGSDGWNIGLIANHTVWIIGLLVATYRSVTPFFHDGKRGVWVELLLSGSFVLFVLAYMQHQILRNEQYLIPTAVFIAFYCADLTYIIWKWFRRNKYDRVLFVVIFLFFLFGLYHINMLVNGPKFALTNAHNYNVLTYALTHIPRDAYVFDLDGSTIYFKDPYFVSAVPFGQWEPYLSRPLPSVLNALISTQTRYIYQSGMKRIYMLPQSDQNYILTNFSPIMDSEFYIR